MQPSPDLLDLAHSHLEFNAPLSPARADDLLNRLALQPGHRILDIGCGDGALLLRAAQMLGTGGVGIDISSRAISRATARAASQGSSTQVHFVEADAQQWREPQDATVCIGSGHIWVGAGPTLQALADLTPAGGRLLFGDGFWETIPSDGAREIFGPLPDLSVLQSLR